MHPAIALYDQAYSTKDLAEIGDLVVQAFTETAILESPWVGTPIIGQEALAEHIRATWSRLQGVVSSYTSPIERVGDTLRWTWAFEADGEVIARGMDVAVLSSDERIQRLVIFDGHAPGDWPQFSLQVSARSTRPQMHSV